MALPPNIVGLLNGFQLKYRREILGFSIVNVILGVLLIIFAVRNSEIVGLYIEFISFIFKIWPKLCWPTKTRKQFGNLVSEEMCEFFK